MREHRQRVKKNLFGSKRVLDGDRSVLRRITRYYGVDHAQRVALLLEGPTEVAFFNRVAECWGIDLAQRGITLYNLGSKDVFVKNRILTQYLQALRNDQVFAYAALDDDGGGEHVKRLNMLAHDGFLSAGFTLWEPDFEGHNFSVRELTMAARNLARASDIDLPLTPEEVESFMDEHPLPVGTAIEKLSAKKKAYIRKGADWGKALADVVCAEDAEIPVNIRDEDGDRPVFNLLAMLIRGHDASYSLTQEQTMLKH
jgi:hypothetical protein